MAGDKKDKGFSSPFRQLKGFCVSGGKETQPDPAPVRPEPEPDVDFAGEMARIGVRQASTRELPPAVKAQEADAPAVPEPADDRELFFAAIGRLETTFVDELPLAAAPAAAPRLKQLLRSDRFAPDAELDLHGLDRLRARERVAHFLDNALYQGKKTVRLVTGRGHGSTGEPVLRTEVENFLAREAGAWVSEWVRAPRRYGGDGAFIVLLRGKKKEN